MSSVDVLGEERVADQLGAFAHFQVSNGQSLYRQGAPWPHRQQRESAAFLSSLPRLFEWASASFFGPKLPGSSTERLAIVLLSYKRPQNIAPLVRSYQRCEFVDAIVVCNNNPEVDIRQYLPLNAPAVRVIERTQPTRQGIRITLAAELGREYQYLATIDDDIFFTPEQLRQLTNALVADPGRLHGFQGERKTRPGERPTNWFKDYDYLLGVNGVDAEIDHLTNAYFFTAEQAQRAVELAEQLAFGDLATLGNGEDLLLSASGASKPMIHDVGPGLSYSAGPRSSPASPRALVSSSSRSASV